MKNYKEDIDKMSFEQALAELEKIVAKLEGGKETLENAIDDYEYGNELRQFCEKKFNEAFIDIVKSYCIDGIATRLTAPVKPKSQPENEYDKLKLDSYKSDIKRIQNIIANKTNQKFILDYLENDLKKISVKIDKYRLAAFIMKTIMFENDTSKVLKGVVTYLKL